MSETVVRRPRAGVVMVVIAAVLVAVTVFWVILSFNQRKATDDAQSALNALGEEIRKQGFGTDLKAVAGLGSSAIIRELVAGKLPQEAAEVRATLETTRLLLDADEVIIGDAAGRVLASAVPPAGRESFVAPVAASFPGLLGVLKGKKEALVVAGEGRRNAYLLLCAPILPEGGGAPLGAVAARIGLQGVLDILDSVVQPTYLISPQGVVFLSNRPETVFSTVSHLPPAEVARLRRDGYVPVGAALTALPFELRPERRIAYEGKSWEAVFRPLDIPGWCLAMMHPTDFPWGAIVISEAMVALLFALVGLDIRMAWKRRCLQQTVREKENAEQAARGRLVFIQSIVNTIPNPVFAMDRNHCWVLLNEAMGEIIGWRKGTLVGKQDTGSLSREVVGRLRSREEDVYASDGPIEDEIDYHDAEGVRRWMVMRRRAGLDDKGRPVLVGVLTDITERKLAEEEIRLKSMLVDASTDMISLAGMDGVMVYANAGLCRSLDYRQAELVGRNISDLEVPAEGPSFSERLSDLVGMTHLVYETRFKAKEGRILNVEIVAKMVRHRECPYLLISARNITDRKEAEAERKRLEAQMQQAQKLESLGVLAGGIAHDFNNLLMGILGNADLALYILPQGSRAIENIREIESAARRAADLCRQMLAYSGKGRFVLEAINLSDLIADMKHMIEISISKNAVLRLNLPRGIPPVTADATQLRQLVMNLVMNASEAVAEPSGVIAISTGARECDEDFLRKTWLDDALPAGVYTVLELSDTGGGMDDNTLQRLFEPFFSTKFMGRGLGMSAVLGIVRSHRGAIEVCSQPDRGTKVVIYLPAAEQPLETPAEESAEVIETSWWGNGLVLLVDDEETVRTVGKRMLEHLGFTVEVAVDGRDAVEKVQSLGQALRGVILDLTMPRMCGDEAYREIRAIRPDLPIVLSSGYTEREVRIRLESLASVPFIQKPYQVPLLRDALRSVLETKKPSSQVGEAPKGGESKET